MKEILGNISSLNKKNLEEIRKLYEYKVPSNQLITIDLIEQLRKLTLKTNKEIALYLDRKGMVKIVCIGSANMAQVPEIWLKRSQNGFSGIRCIHTHPNGSSFLSKADLSTLINLKLDAIIALGIGKITTCSVGFLQPENGEITTKFQKKEELSIANLLAINFQKIIFDLEKLSKVKGYLTEAQQEKALLVTVQTDKVSSDVTTEETIIELSNLAETAGLTVIDVIIQKRSKPDPAFFIGKGKLDEIALQIQNSQANCIVFEETLSPSQQNNLIEYLGIKVLDRTSLILDIFAQRAKSKEGKLQVELAQLNYLLPRLKGMGVSLSRLGGGVGTRGPGETKLETDRRHIRKKIQNLKKELIEVKKHRCTQQNNRLKRDIPLISLVGYTNAGKSSLLNSLAEDNVFEENKLFATLDTTTRSFYLDGKRNKVLLTDTVGFIRNLPHQLIPAFKSTLEEVQLAEVLLHVVDISNKNFENQIKTVQNVLAELNVLDKPIIYVFNKIDLLTEEPIIPFIDNYCFVSTKSGKGLNQLKKLIKEELFPNEKRYKLIIPYEESYLLNEIYQKGNVEIINHREIGTEVVFIGRIKDIPREFIKYKVME